MHPCLTPRIVAVGRSPIWRTDLPGRDLFSVALAEAFEGLPGPAEVVETLPVGGQSGTCEHRGVYGTLLAARAAALSDEDGRSASQS